MSNTNTNNTLTFHPTHRNA